MLKAYCDVCEIHLPYDSDNKVGKSITRSFYDRERYQNISVELRVISRQTHLFGVSFERSVRSEEFVRRSEGE